MVMMCRISPQVRMYFVQRGQGAFLREMPEGICRWEPRPILRKRRKIRERVLSERLVQPIALGRLFK